MHCQPSLAGAGHVIKYLGGYTHRVAITNERILNITDNKVTFVAKDYRDNAIKKSVTMDGIEFLRRFTMHILPKRFVKIRRFGIYNHTVKRKFALQFTEEEKPGIDTLLKRQQPPETNHGGLKGSPELVRVNARCAKPEEWLQSGNYRGYGLPHGTFLRNR